MSSSIRVLIADDQQLVRTGLRMILDAQPDIDVVGEATDGREAVAMTRELQPDVVLMDIRMPEVDGIEATRRVVQRDGETSTRVLMLTTFDLDEYVYDALRAGASGFLLKDVPSTQLAAGVRMVAAGDALLAPSITGRLIEEFAATHPPLRLRQDSTNSRRASSRSSASSRKANQIWKSPPSWSSARRP